MTPSQEELLSLIPAAIGEGTIAPHFQPIVSLEDGEVVGLEVLARWDDDRYGSIPPTVFIPLTEQLGLLDQLFQSLLVRATWAARGWPKNVFLAFNVSPHQFESPDLPLRIATAAHAAEFPFSRIHIEITETSIFQDLEFAKSILDTIIAMGCHIVIDDFGTGHASLTWLLKLPITKIKIDQLFIQSMLSSKESRKIVSAVIGLGRSLECSIVAEGVETREQAEFLSRLGCEMVQGFHYGHAVPADDVPGMMKAFPKPVSGQGRPRMSLEQSAYQIASMYRWDDLTMAFADGEGRLVDASPSFVRRLGLPKREATGKTLQQLSSPAFNLQGVLPGGVRPANTRHVVEQISSTGRVDMMSVHDVRDEVGDVVGFSILCIDITDVRIAQSIAKDRQQRFDFVVENCPHVLWATHSDGRISYINSHWHEISGMPRETIKTRDALAYVHPDQRAIVERLWRTARDTGAVYDGYHRHLLADGEFHWVRCWAAPYRNEAGEISSWYGTLSVIDPPRPPGGGPPLRFAEPE